MTKLEELRQNLSKIPSPPDWFKARMEDVRKTPPLSLQEMQAQFRGGIAQRAKLR